MTKVRLSSPLFEDGPWLKDPIGPDMFRHRQLGEPGNKRVNTVIEQDNVGGSRRVTPLEPSIGSAHKAHKGSNQYDDSGRRNSKSKGNR